MTGSVETLLLAIFIMLCVICMYIRWIYLRLEYNEDPLGFQKPVNQYGENFTDAIQNGHERGLRGINTNG